MARTSVKAQGTGKINLTPRAVKKKPRSIKLLDEKYTGTEPEWTGCENWTYEKFHAEKVRAYYYYNYFNSTKDLVSNVIQWMSKNGYSKDDIVAYKEMPEWRTSITMCSIATMMNRGCLPKHPAAPVEQRGADEWLKTALLPIIQDGRVRLQAKSREEHRAAAPVLSIQDRIKEATQVYIEELEIWLDEFIVDPNSFDPKKINVSSFFKIKEINQAHARLIRDFFEPVRNEIYMLVEPGREKGSQYAQLVEGYRSYTKAQLKNRLAAYDEILSACDMFLRQAKVNRKPRVKKAPSKEKLISKLKFKINDERYKLVSIKPEECLQAVELWVFNTKTRKLGVYVPEEFQVLSVKGSSIVNFDAKKSIAKTVRKPEELLKGAAALPRTKLRKLFEGIKGVDTLLNGRINEDIVLLKSFNN